MSMTYYWKDGYRGKRGDPQAVGRELERLQEENGSISPADVLETARPDASILHPFFEWEDKQAAEMYRMEQARDLIRHIVVRIEKDDDEENDIVTRAFVEIKGEQGPYLSLPVVLQNVDLRKQLVDQARHDIRVFENKYAALKEVIKLIQPVKNALEEMG